MISKWLKIISDLALTIILKIQNKNKLVKLFLSVLNMLGGRTGPGFPWKNIYIIAVKEYNRRLICMFPRNK